MTVSGSLPGDGPLTVGVDVGGTKIATALVAADGRVLGRAGCPSDGLTYDELVTAITHTVTDVITDPPGDWGDRVVGVGLAIAGNVSADRSRVETSPHLPLHGQPLQADLQRAGVGAPVVVENDANAAAWAEWVLGPHAGLRDLALVTVGTGLGGGIVMGGRLQRGAHGFAGEPGHVIVVPDGRACPCGGHGCWEQYASGTALGRAYRELGGDPSVTGPAVTTAAQRGDPLALAAFDEIGRWLGLGLAGVVAMLDPGVIILGGGVGEAGDLLLRPTREGLAHHLAWGGRRQAPPIEAAVLGNDAGAVGAALLAAAAQEA
jgi:glucokinase